jgi:hypothetical protein
MKLKLKGRHFDTTEAIVAEWQAVMNDYITRLPGCFKKW